MAQRLCFQDAIESKVMRWNSTLESESYIDADVLVNANYEDSPLWHKNMLQALHISLTAQS